ncbi:hypothetical protein BASA50_010978 [Batrachochytrium salamandrivorans]|uniref:Eukaryotic translation initiation factor 3 subunit G n=1 Tax=Batrachochytrium salamandrivorans TaxID=1357716 RepID=A0ABQ8EZU6_9FUNG|nr:hypothetical protein BASA62_008175 [Batrachochytrium salamandrivorans]KAH6567799.1 hypothetical protein BASA60_008889 [Batrachochytrium salamandrivorans]KAH6585445.1 hypothetical protein BASA61_006792 [Batrachochytrium salamandrivorans]KAH6587959.1 hypothetical protein BASA50_010978 [Batrachochytrium salamandrivorans]KAH9270507.1 hypothetical protein BASA83_007319 [Batrachochytrium salamandrivorans]
MAPTVHASRHSEDWLEDDESGPSQDLPPSSTVIQPDGTHVVTTYSLNSDGKKVKTVKRIRMKLVKAKVNLGVAERKRWKKFGESAGLPAGPDSGSTSYGEKVFLKLSMTTKDFDAAAIEDKKADKPVGASNIMCRICKGDHFTTRCPYKDTFKPFNEISSPADTAADAAAAGAAPDKYISPAMRNRAAGATDQGGMGMRMDSRRDDTNTIRISNLSEDASDGDVRDLVSKFGMASRVYVAKDHATQQCKGFAFVTFIDRMTAERVISKLNGHGYDNLILSVDWSRSKD